MVRHFLKDDDVNSAEQAEIIRRAIALKKAPYSERPFAGPKTVALIFDKTSTRTRVSFSVGVADLGGVPLIIDSQTSQMGGKESVADTARVLTRQVAQIVWRTYSQAGLEEMAAHSHVPVINSLSDDYHPCQILADLMTVQEHKDRLAGLKFAYIGDAANNMANSYLIGCALAGMHVRVAAPAGYEPDLAIVQRASAIAETTGGSVSVFGEPESAILEADVVATDTWISMGQEAEKTKRIQDFAGYTIDSELMSKAATDAIFLHCLPAYRGYEVAAEVLDGPQSVIWDEAENRLHAQKALMVWLDEQLRLSNPA
ncbi:MAG: ornithine carbamoyltransferase [Micrococcales bacterium]